MTVNKVRERVGNIVRDWLVDMDSEHDELTDALMAAFPELAGVPTADDGQVERISRILARTSTFTQHDARLLVETAQAVAKAEALADLEAAQPVKLDRAKVAEVLCRYMDEDSGEGGVCPACKGQARALCDAAERGELNQ